MWGDHSVSKTVLCDLTRPSQWVLNLTASLRRHEVPEKLTIPAKIFVYIFCLELLVPCQCKSLIITDRAPQVTFISISSPLVN